MTKILDCTLRDGGHVNNWEFSNECVLASLHAAEITGIEYFEAGYNMPECIKSSKTKLVAMVDAKNIQPVSLIADCVRVACYPHQIITAVKAVEDFKNQGFEVFLHLMTFGAFMPSDVERIYKKLQNCGFENISFHAHNNLQLAFTNTIKAIELGAYSVDGCIFGMGRGGGNLPLELLLKYLNKDYEPYIELINKYYLPRYNQYGWGYGFEALISGLKNVHPDKVSQAIV